MEIKIHTNLGTKAIKKKKKKKKEEYQKGHKNRKLHQEKRSISHISPPNKHNNGDDTDEIKHSSKTLLPNPPLQISNLKLPSPILFQSLRSHSEARSAGPRWEKARGGGSNRSDSSQSLNQHWSHRPCLSQARRNRRLFR